MLLEAKAQGGVVRDGEYDFSSERGTLSCTKQPDCVRRRRMQSTGYGSACQRQALAAKRQQKRETKTKGRREFQRHAQTAGRGDACRRQGLVIARDNSMHAQIGE